MVVVQRITIGPLERKKKKKMRLEEEIRTRKLHEDKEDRSKILKIPTVSTINNHTALQCLPHHLVIDNILSRLPINSLLRSGCVSKFWYKTIFNDQDLLSAQFVQSQKNPTLMFHFFNVGYSMKEKKDQYFLYLLNEDIEMISDAKVGRSSVQLRTLLQTPIGGVGGGGRSALVGHCNGLVCVSSVCRKRGRMIQFYNPSRRELFATVPPFNVILSMKAYGFGFNSLTKEYKVVCIVKGLKYCLVYTLGSNSWREIKGPNRSFISSSNCGIPSCGDFNCGKSAISCDGALFWHIKKSYHFLMFDLHKEMFRVIKLPQTGWDWYPSEQICWRFLEFKGSLCVARIEKFSKPNQNGKVYLHILKDRIKQVWIKETFFVPFPLEPTIQVASFFNQVLLYWFHGECLQFYNLHTKASKLVHYPGGRISENKYRRDLRNTHHTGYRVYNYVPNFLSLRTFLPREARRKDSKKSHQEKDIERSYLFGNFIHGKFHKSIDY